MSTERKTILVVDDEPSNIALLSGVLKESHKVKAATGGEKALRIAQKSPPPDLILLDVMMPEIDGYEVCKQLKADPATQNIPIAFVTGNISDEEQQRGMNLGAIAYLGKPIDSTKLLDLVNQLFS